VAPAPSSTFSVGCAGCIPSISSPRISTEDRLLEDQGSLGFGVQGWDRGSLGFGVQGWDQGSLGFGVQGWDRGSLGFGVQG
jgi:hypothetical protein